MNCCGRCTTSGMGDNNSIQPQKVARDTKREMGTMIGPCGQSFFLRFLCLFAAVLFCS